MTTVKPTILVNKKVVSKDGKEYDIPQVVVHMDALDPSKVEIGIKPTKKGPTSAPAKAAPPAKPYYYMRYPHTDGRTYDMLIRMTSKKDVVGIRSIDSYPPTEEDPLKQQHTIKISPVCEDYLAKMDSIHEKVLDFVMSNQLIVLGNKTNKKREIIEEVTKSVVKRDTDAEGNPYPPRLRAKVKFDAETGVPKLDTFRKEGNSLIPVLASSIEELRNEINTSYDRVITVEPSFYVMGSQCGWTLALQSILLGEKTARQVVDRPAYTEEDLNEFGSAPTKVEVPIPKVEAKVEPEFTPEETETENVPETAVIASDEDDEVEIHEEGDEELDLPPPPQVSSKPRRGAQEEAPIPAPKTTTRRAAARK